MKGQPTTVFLMNTTKIDAGNYVRMVGAGTSYLNDNRKVVNDLNVFPIPDGDTGDNMYMTINAGWNAAEIHSSIAETAQTVSRGMLLGARGNSGVILSRIFAGISKGLTGVDEADLDAFKKAMRSGVEESYKAVSNPVEGTILTVFKDSVRAAECCDGTFEEYFKLLCEESEKSLARTPALLDVLARAGVVDSGGAGLVHILSGMRASLDPEASWDEGSVKDETKALDLSLFNEDSVLEYGYCTEFLLRLQRSKVDVDVFDASEIIDYLNSVGESVVAFREGTIVKAHVHTMTPGEILNHCQRWGEFLTIKIENMTLQHHESHKYTAKLPHKKAAVVTVASGEGLVGMLKDTGADFVIEGGQTMNPSASDFIAAFDQVNADIIYVLPNNSNIILTANQAAGMYADSKVIVLPTKSIGAGYTVLGSIDFTNTAADEVPQMAQEIIDATVTGMVSRAVRDTDQAREGEYIGFVKDDILCSSSDRVDALSKLCSSLDAASSDVIIVIAGADVSETDAARAESVLSEAFPLAEIAMVPGGQPVFDFIVIIQ